jgi:hypothetical protein
MKKDDEAEHQMPRWISDMARKLFGFDRLDVNSTAGQSVVKTNFVLPLGIELCR